MPKIPVFSDKEMISLLEKNGFIFSRQRGSHKIFIKKEFPPISVPCHGKDLKRGLTARILKDTGINLH
ncbi:MAG: type II toxin-antitoxin system HicA family toxin [Candidatus Parcubacteria bacterium]|nr:type II toxin-antitoxin system HicA family toxin [Candidatus Parcubacteria bacterium]